VIVSPLDWKRRVCLHGCILHESPEGCEGPLQAHHVVTQQTLRKRGLDNAIWDTRMGVAVCERSHIRHTLASSRIRFEDLPASVVEYVQNLGLQWYLDRYYPRTRDTEAADTAS